MIHQLDVYGNDKVETAIERLKGSTSHLIQIEHRDALELIGRYDTPDVLMYLDPPYVLSARKSGKIYDDELDSEDHEKLLELIAKSRAKILISGYENPLYDDKLAGWYKDTIMSRTTSTAMAKEVLWQNYEPPMRQLTFEEIT